MLAHLEHFHLFALLKCCQTGQRILLNGLNGNFSLRFFVLGQVNDAKLALPEFTLEIVVMENIFEALGCFKLLDPHFLFMLMLKKDYARFFRRDNYLDRMECFHLMLVSFPACLCFRIGCR